eukprot:GHVT01013700.1.p2 GENE.GHVT01013700.1~~GHVT01013700.1.p2  ORF type:complete len:108 (-),score=5.18 GHVT01013700.1:523-846(-)
MKRTIRIYTLYGLFTSSFHSMWGAAFREYLLIREFIFSIAEISPRQKLDKGICEGIAKENKQKASAEEVKRKSKRFKNGALTGAPPRATRSSTHCTKYTLERDAATV